MKKIEMEELLDHMSDILEDLEARIVKLEDMVYDCIDEERGPDPIELALDESGYEDLEAEAFIEGYLRAEKDLTEEE